MEKNLKDLIRQGEGINLEFKRSITSLEKIAKTITALANSKGGTLLIGVEDNGHVSGVNTDEELYMVQQAAEFYCKPAVTLGFEEIEHDDKQLLLVHIPESQDKPHHCIDTAGTWRCYVRTGDQCLLASDSVLRAMRRQATQAECAEPPKLTNNEQQLLAYLSHRNKITVKDYAKLINVSRRRAARILFELIKNGQIYEHDYNNTCYYTLAS